MTNNALSRTIRATGLAVLLCPIAATLSAQKYQQHHKRYADNFTYEKLGDETVRATWYHYVTSLAEDGGHIVRVFHPDIGQLTSRTHYADPQHLVKHGPQQQWWDNGQPRTVGHYEENVKAGHWVYWEHGSTYRREGRESQAGKQGPWTEWYSEHRKARELTYRNDILEGPFVFYDSLGVEKSRGRYEKGVIVETDNAANPEVVEETQPGWKGCEDVGNTQARTRCRDEHMYRFLSQTIKYPKKAMDLDIEGQALIGFTVTKAGELKDIKVLSGICREIENECLRVVELMPAWEPGYQRGKPVNVRFTLPIKFTMR